jgi:ubiquinone/menaquinone biosynthesis C-methylase UbiE
MKTREELQRKYDLLAPEYAERFCDELAGKPFDCHLLERFARSVPAGTVCDLGCGPGHVAAHLQSLGVETIGVDLSSQMIAQATRRYPTLTFRVGDMLDLKMEAGSLGGIVALYSIIHLRRDMLQMAFHEMNRVLRPGGLLLVSFHQGQGELHEDEVLGTQVSFDCTLFEPGEVALALAEAGFDVVETTVRRPYEIEYPTQRVYILADKGTG